MLRSLQGCRAVAAFFVVLYHASNGIFDYPHYFGPRPFGAAFDFAYASVDVLLVLSGFIIMHVHMRDLDKPRALGAYLWKRLSRIYPAYWVALAVLIPMFFLSTKFAGRPERELDVILTSAFLLPHPKNLLVLTVAWSLVYELCFYVLFGVLILSKRVGVVMFASWACCIVIYPFFNDVDRWFLINPWHLRFMLGMVTAVVIHRWGVPGPRLLAVAGMALFATAAFMEVTAGPLTFWTRTVAFSIASTLIVAGLAQADLLGTLPKTPDWLCGLGNASYSIYLMHYPALGVIAKPCKALRVDEYVPHQLLFVGHVVGAMAAGYGFYLLVEKPLHGWSRRYFRDPAPQVQPAAAYVQKAA